MITIASGNLLKADVDALVNTVNTEGVMGKGIALQFKRAFPEVYEKYEADCDAGLVRIGHMHIVDLGGLVGGPRWVINFPTKRHWRARSKLQDIEVGLEDLVHQIQRLEIKSIAIPPLGCGHGGLNWRDVRPLIEAAMHRVPNTQALIYPPDGVPDAVDMPNRTTAPKMSLGSAAVIALMSRYRDGLLDPFVRLLEVHKLLYFLQEAGEPLKLKYEAHTYGPYSSNLRHVLARIEGHWITGYGDGQDAPQKCLDLSADAVSAAYDFLEERFDTLERMERVAALIEGYESPYGLELLSTTHWVMTHVSEASESADSAVQEVRKWSPRKAESMKPEHIVKAWTRLRDHRWDVESRSSVH